MAMTKLPTNEAEASHFALRLIAPRSFQSWIGGPKIGFSRSVETKFMTNDTFENVQLDIRDADGVARLFAAHASDLEIVIHTAAQPSHDWAASDPATDFTVNANGTLALLEAARLHRPEATFVNMSTNKVYGDLPNSLPITHTVYGRIPTQTTPAPDTFTDTIQVTVSY